MRLHATKLGAISSGRGLGDQLYDLAGAVPSLDLQFAGTKTLDPRVTFTRASSGTYVGSDGLFNTAATNEPRFDHNPVTGESLGLLVEEPRTNLLLRSEEFGTTWTPTGASVSSNVIAAPNGSLTADALIEDSSTGDHRINQASLSVSSGFCTYSIYVKANTRSRVVIQFDGTVNSVPSSALVNVDLSTGTTSGLTATGNITSPSSSISALLDGWYRVSITASLSAATSGLSVRLFLLQNTGGTSYTGNGTGSVYLWGAQLEAGAFPTSYIPTTGATATRAADVASITGANFSSWYNQAEGTVFASFNSVTWNQDPIFPKAFTLATDDNNSIWVGGDPTDNVYRYRVRNGGTNQFGAGTIARASSTNNKIALAFKAADFGISADGSNLVTGSTGTIPTVNQLVIGFDIISATNYANQPIKRLTFWPTRLANTTLQSITQP